MNSDNCNNNTLSHRHYYSDEDDRDSTSAPSTGSFLWDSLQFSTDVNDILSSIHSSILGATGNSSNATNGIGSNLEVEMKPFLPRTSSAESDLNSESNDYHFDTSQVDNHNLDYSDTQPYTHRENDLGYEIRIPSSRTYLSKSEKDQIKLKRKRRRSRRKVEEINRNMISSYSNYVNSTTNNHIDYMNDSRFQLSPLNKLDRKKNLYGKATMSYDADDDEYIIGNNDISVEQYLSTTPTRRRKRYLFDSPIDKDPHLQNKDNVKLATKRNQPSNKTNFWFLPNNKNSNKVPPTIPEFDGEDDEDVDQHNHVVFEDLIIDPVVEVMDRLEDEIDGHTYDNFVPLPIKLALEEQVFGWSHLFSAFFGHLFFTCLAYLATYHFLNIICLHKVPIMHTTSTPFATTFFNNDESDGFISNNRKRIYDKQSSQNQQNDEQICFNSIRCFVHDVFQWAFTHDDNDDVNNITAPDNLAANNNSVDFQMHNASYFIDGNGNVDQRLEYVLRWDIISLNNFYIFRLLISIMMAISAFRTVRRRRQVWLRSSYGTEEYYRDADDRRHRVEQTDKQTVLGTLRNSLQKKRDRWLSERVQRKLKKAEHRFQQRRFQFQKLQQYDQVQNSDMRAQTEHDGEHDYMSQHTIPDYDDWSESETSSVTSFTTNNNTLSNSTLKLLLDDAYGGHRLKFGDKVEDNDEDYEDDESDGNSISSSMTKNSNQRLDAYRKHKRKSPKSSKMLMTITRDEVSFASGPIKNLPYVHGGFFGAAPFMLADPHWIDILRHLMPDVYVELSHRVLHTSVSKLILWAENNPVVAAYGTAYEILNHSSQNLSKPERKSKRKKESKQRVIATTLEWDIFLDPHLVHNLETVLKHRDKFLDKENNLKQKDPLPSATIDGNTTENSKEMKIKKSKTESILLSFQHEIQRRARLLVENMLIAHGNLNQLFMEQCGFFKQYNFSRVKRTRRTLGGGIFATNWCAIYAEALQLGLQKNHQGDQRKTINDKSFHNISTPQYDEKLIEIPSAKYSFDGNPSNQNSFEDSDKECYDSDDTISCQSMSSIESVRNAVDSSVSIDERRLKNLRSKQKQKEKQKISGMNILPNFDEQKNNEIPGSSLNMLRQNRELKRSFSSTSLNELALNTCPTWSISESISLIKDIMKKYHNDQSDHDESNENEYVPLRLLLDLKSRHIPKRVLALVVDTLEETGIQVDGIASFIIDEIRDISQYCTSPVNEIYFFHSAGEIQAACHNGLLKNCCCYFNAGNLFWEKPESIGEYIRLGSEIFQSAMTLEPFDADQAKKSYKFQSFSRINKVSRNDELHLHDHDKDNDINMNNLNHMKIKSSQKNVTIDYEKDFESDGDSCSTIQEYKDHYNLSIGLYVQEFAIDASAISLITQYVNENPHVYELGLSWGGINGLTVGGIQPGRVTNTDGFWNQRYGGVRWNSSKHPGNVDHPHH